MRKEKSLLSDRAYARVKDGILSRTYTPGTPLVELDLSRRLGIGRTPIREALRQLREEGLVRVVQNRGAFVERMGYTDIEEALFLRELLEVAALHRGIGRLPHDRLAELRAAFTRFADAFDPFPAADCLAADVSLHELIVEAACSPRLKKFHKQLADQIHFLRHLQADRMPASIAEHLAIIEALQTGNAAEAERALRQHMAKIRENLYQNRHLL
jgi:GntR family transcriptional regulator, rspAB operon transcriptional repressor